MEIWHYWVPLCTNPTATLCLQASLQTPTLTLVYLHLSTMHEAILLPTVLILTIGILMMLHTDSHLSRTYFLQLITQSLQKIEIQIMISANISNLINKIRNSADPISGQLVGVLTNAPPSWTQIVRYNYSTHNTTYVGSPLTAQNYAFCGSARGAVSQQGTYFVVCCTDPLCLNGSVVYSNSLTNNNMNFVTKISASVTFGLFAL